MKGGKVRCRGNFPADLDIADKSLKLPAVTKAPAAWCVLPETA
jgi:hypothetical protein